MRLNSKQLNNLKDMYNVDRIWSFSRINTAHNCMWEFWAKYIKHYKLDTSNVYTVFGTFSHDLIQDMIANKISYDQMTMKWDEIVKEWQEDPNAYQFDNDKIKVGYISNLNHYFAHTTVPKGSNFQNEKPVMAKIGKKTDGAPKYVFVGYVDTQYVDEDGNTVLIDYKTSSKSSFSKAKLPEKSRQLMLYALAKHQHNGIPYEKIKCRFDMMKYVTVHFKQENGKWNTSVQERAKWVSKMEKKLATKLKKFGLTDTEVAEKVQIASLSNSLEKLPQKVREQFFIDNYYIDLDVTEENCNQLAKELEADCDAIVKFEQLTNEEQESYLEANCRYDPDNYYDKKLCAYHTSEMFKEKERSINDLLEPQLSTKTDEVSMTGVFDEDDDFASIFEL